MQHIGCERQARDSLDRFDFTLGVKRVCNRSPPYASYASITNNFAGGYDLSYGDPRDHYVYATIEDTLE